MKTFSVVAGWLSPEEKIGTCEIERARGKEILSFEYDRKWLERHPEFSFDPDIYPMRGRQYPPTDKPCFGFLADSAPDRWGRKLMDRREMIDAREGSRPRRTLMESDYILGVHDGGRIGGLRFFDEKEGVYLSNRKTLAAPPMEMLRELEHAAVMLEEGDAGVEKWLRNLLDPGSSLGGSRPKSNVLDEHGNMWIAKFPSKHDDADMGAWEMLAHNLAEKCGINTPDARIMKLSDAGTTFLVKRFDRLLEKRIHFVSAMTMLGQIDGASAGYLDLAGLTEQFCRDTNRDIRELWKRMVFNICVSNTDDHLRNHGFILGDGGWELSPVFDVNPNIEKRTMSLTIAQTDHIDITEVLELADFFRMKKSEAIAITKKIQSEIRANWKKEADRLGITKREQNMMQEAFSQASTVLLDSKSQDAF